MDMILLALSELFSLHQFFFLCLGVLIGMVVGILPGMGGTAGMALLLPFVYGMDQASALALMIGMLATTATGDTFPSILMGIPGGSSSATVLDGFPLARKGHAARALSASFTASLMGGIFGAFVLTACVFIARPLILAIGMGEQLLLILLALTMVGSLTGASPFKGLAACGIGLLDRHHRQRAGDRRTALHLRQRLSQRRHSAGRAGARHFRRSRNRRPDAPALGHRPRRRTGRRLRRRHSRCLRAIGGWCCASPCSAPSSASCPASAASTADWLAYGHVVQSSKDRSQFGKGDIRGVIAPEAANNAVRGGDLVPTLFFGIPGSGSMALLLGAFILIGLEPGARMVGENMDLTFLIIWSLALGNIFGAVLCILLAGPIAKLTLIRYAFLAPLIVVLMVFTAYQATLSWGDIVALLLLTIVGLYMKRFDWSRPALVVGFVLSPGLEASLYQTAQVYGFSFLQRPQAIIIALMVLASLVVGLRMMFDRAARMPTPEAEPPTSPPAAGRNCVHRRAGRHRRLCAGRGERQGRTDPHLPGGRRHGHAGRPGDHRPAAVSSPR